MLRSYKKQTNASRRLRVEHLEHKAMLAGDVVTAVVGGNLTITGGVDDETIELEATATVGEYLIRGTGGTTVNGLAEDTVTGVTGNVTVDLGGGLVNSFTSIEASLPGDLSYTSSGDESGFIYGGGFDFDDPRVTLGGSLFLDYQGSTASGALNAASVVGDVVITGELAGEGDGFGLSSVDIGGDLTIDLDLATGPFFLVNVNSVGGNVDLDLDGDEAEVIVNSEDFDDDITSNMIVAGDFSLTLGDGVLEGIIRRVDATGDVQVETGEGEASIELNQVTSAADISLTDNAGENDLFLTSSNAAGDILVQADNSSNEIRIIESTTGDDLRITGGDNGSLVIAQSIAVGDDLVLQGGAGDDILTFEVAVATSTVGDDLYARGRAGNDQITIRQVDVADRMRVGGGGGDDSVTILATNVGRSTLVSLGQGVNDATIDGLDGGRSLSVYGRGVNTIGLSSVQTTHFVTVLTANGADLVELDDVTTFSAMVATSAGEDEVAITDSVFDTLAVFLGSGDDSLTLQGVTVDRFAILSGGSGEDTLVDEGDNDIDFAIDFGFEVFES